MRVTLSAYAVEDGAVLLGLTSGHSLFLMKDRQWFPIPSPNSDDAELGSCLIEGAQGQYLTVSGGAFDLLTGPGERR